MARTPPGLCDRRQGLLQRGTGVAAGLVHIGLQVPGRLAGPAVVGKEFVKKNRKFEKRRPDFVCGTLDNKLIVIELKRPSHELTAADLNQLERYVIICRKYDDSIKSFEAILVGKKKSRELESVLRVRGGNWKVRTYTQLISDAERRYKNYLDRLTATD